jgi:hypothetical protein
MIGIWKALTEAGLLPHGSSPPAPGMEESPGTDLLPAIVWAWTHCKSASRHPRSKEGAGRAGLLKQHWERGAKLTWGIPKSDDRRLASWLGNRLAWWPQGIPEGRRIGLVSSRLGRDLDRRKSWFTVLRAACMKVDRQHEILLTAGSVTTGRFVQRCGELFGLRVLCVDIDRDGITTLPQWARTTVVAGEVSRACGEVVSLSPPLSIADGARTDEPLAQLPAANLDRLLRARLDEPAFPPASVYLALGPDLVPQDLAVELMQRGAVGWCVLNAVGGTDDKLSLPWPPAGAWKQTSAPIAPLPASGDWPYLTHCTRRRRGPWPGEDENQFLDDLILDRAGADHSALAALWRIVRTSRLIAGSQIVRGNVPVVSFTAVPLVEIHRLHTFRRHLGRWDFAPYGICIRRDWLQSRGARAVRYGDEGDWRNLPDAERPFFQKRQSETTGGQVIDWTAEREWRHLGDVPLDAVPCDAALLFVPTEAEARQLATASRWPVVLSPWR